MESVAEAVVAERGEKAQRVLYLNICPDRCSRKTRRLPSGIDARLNPSLPACGVEGTAPIPQKFVVTAPSAFCTLVGLLKLSSAGWSCGWLRASMVPVTFPQRIVKRRSHISPKGSARLVSWLLAFLVRVSMVNPAGWCLR